CLGPIVGMLYTVFTFKAVAKQRAVEGTPIVQAVRRYRTDKGAWPDDLKALVPDYLPQSPTDRWEYAQSGDQAPPKLSCWFPPHCTLTYYFAGATPAEAANQLTEPGWVLNQEGTVSRLPEPP